jgi:hypothetical protein
MISVHSGQEIEPLYIVNGNLNGDITNTRDMYRTVHIDSNLGQYNPVYYKKVLLFKNFIFCIQSQRTLIILYH